MIHESNHHQRASLRTEESSSTRNDIPHRQQQSERAKVSMNIIEQLYEQIVNADWSKYFETIKEEKQ